MDPSAEKEKNSENIFDLSRKGGLLSLAQKGQKSRNSQMTLRTERLDVKAEPSSQSTWVK